MILLIDNYDSFTHNLEQLVGSFNHNAQVMRNDEITVERIEKLSFSHIIISSGSGHPRNAGICRLIQRMIGVPNLA